jgi:hypothetical protein
MIMCMIVGMTVCVVMVRMLVAVIVVIVGGMVVRMRCAHAALSLATPDFREENGHPRSLGSLRVRYKLLFEY